MRPEEREFVGQWIADFNERVAAFSLFVFGAYWLVGAPLVQFNGLPYLHEFSYVTHSLGFAYVLAVQYFVRRRGRPAANFVLGLHVAACLAMAVYTYIALNSLVPYRDVNARWMVGVTYIGLTMFVTLAMPVTGRMWVVPSLLLHGVAAAIMVQQQLPWFYLLVMGFTSALTFSVKQGSGLLLRAAGQRAYTMRDLALSSERQKYKHELELARRIQSSMDLPKFQRLSKHTTATFVQVVREQVGGDWAALKEFADGTTVALMADAAGKGMQAALVVHAVQSLWTSVLDAPRFDAAAWLNQLNITLFYLGVKEPHAVTVGLLEITEGTKLRYWSAGHLPLIIMQHDPRGQRRVHRLFGQGDMLGLGRNATIRPVRYELTSDKSEIILATDGVLPTPSRCHDREVVNLIDKLATAKDGEPLTSVDDDQTVIWLSHRRAA